MSIRGIVRIASFLVVTAILTLASLGVALANGPGPSPVLPHPIPVPPPIPIPPPPRWGQAPELDLTMIVAALTVFGGVAALLIERYRRRQHRVTT
jgi:hypothetical protein